MRKLGLSPPLPLHFPPQPPRARRQGQRIGCAVKPPSSHPPSARAPLVKSHGDRETCSRGAGGSRSTQGRYFWPRSQRAGPACGWPVGSMMSHRRVRAAGVHLMAPLPARSSRAQQRQCIAPLQQTPLPLSSQHLRRPQALRAPRLPEFRHRPSPNSPIPAAGHGPARRGPRLRRATTFAPLMSWALRSPTAAGAAVWEACVGALWAAHSVRSRAVEQAVLPTATTLSPSARRRGCCLYRTVPGSRTSIELRAISSACRTPGSSSAKTCRATHRIWGAIARKATVVPATCHRGS